jgi:ferredoxin-type protein NapG
MPAITRREVIGGCIGAAALIAIGGGTKLASAAEPTLLRPPGGADESEFFAKCIRCDRCRSACPLHAIGVASVDDGWLNARTPKMDFRTGYCDFCTDASGTPQYLCIKACPTGALLDSFDMDTDWIGPAVVDEDQCVAFPNPGSCLKCIDECPYGAISNVNGRPVVDTAKCNGCGKCENICPSASYHSYNRSTDASLGTKRGINVELPTSKRG